MAIIGTFTKQDTGYQGVVATLTVKTKVNIAPVEKTSEKSPDYRVYSGSAEIGAAWSAESKEGNKYLTVKLDDPSFSAPIHARLVEFDNKNILVWTR